MEPVRQGRSPDLLFCRRCGESVARRDILAGRALLLEGGAACPVCVTPVLRRRRVARAATAVAAVVLGAGLAFSLVRLQRRVAAVERVAAAARLRVERVAASLGILESEVHSRRAELRGLQELVATLGRSVEASGADRAATREAVEDRVDSIERSLAVLVDGIESLRRDLEGGRTGGTLTAAEEEALLEHLDDPNPGTRLSALVTLRRGTGRAARQAAVRGLADSQEIVRHQAALLARHLNVAEAVPALVDCLEHGSPLVRESAIETLEVLEGTALDFDPLGPEEERAAALERWRERIRER